MILDATTKSLEVLLAGAVAANQLPVFAGFADYTPTTFTPAASDTQTNNTTPVTIMAAPAAATQRQARFVFVFNEDTAAATVTVRLNNNGTFRNVVRRTLQPGETLSYDGRVWLVLAAGELHARQHALGSAVDHTGTVTDAQLGSRAAYSVIGRAGNSAGVPADIAAAADYTVLQRMGPALYYLAFDFIGSPSLAAGAVTGVKLATGPRTRTVLLVVPGNPAAAAMVSVQIIIPKAGTITAIKSTCRVAPSTTYTYDVNKDGATIYTTQANRPTRLNGDGNAAKTHTAPDVTALADGSVLSVDLDTAGTTISDVAFHVEYLPT